MPFQNPGSNVIVGSVTQARRDTDGLTTLTVHVRNLKYTLDTRNLADARVLEDARERFESLREESAGPQNRFMESYLKDRFAMKISFVVSDPTSGSRRARPVTIKFTRLQPAGRFGSQQGTFRPTPFPRWEETDVIPFSKVFAQSFSDIDLFSSGGEYLFSGGEWQIVEADSVDINPTESIAFQGGQIPLPGTGQEVVTLA